MSACGRKPYRGIAYGHWTCQRPKWHVGPHRFNNYTIPRWPHVHSAVPALIRKVKWAWQYRHYEKKPNACVRHFLWPATYSPLPIAAYRPDSAPTTEKEQ